MTYVGFDIGVKNLCFCCIDPVKWRDYHYNKGKDPGVIQWKNISLIPEDYICSGITKKGIVCGKKAGFAEKEKHYCGMHKTLLSKAKKQPSVKTYSINDILKRCFTELDVYSELFQKVEVVVIEAQLKANNRMMRLSCGINSYFILRHGMDPASVLSNVIYSSARNKLKVYRGKCAVPTRGKILKKLAIEHVKCMLPEDVLEKWFHCCDKKDDLADSFLHCVFYIR